MSAQPVDVLAVLDAINRVIATNVQRLALAGDPLTSQLIAQREECEQARAAVAELIEAAKFARLTGNGPTGYTPGADRRLASALAKVQP